MTNTFPVPAPYEGAIHDKVSPSYSTYCTPTAQSPDAKIDSLSAF